MGVNTRLIALTRGRRRWGSPELSQNLLDHAVQVGQHFLIPKPYDTVAALVKQLRATSIPSYQRGIVAMLRTVNFDYQVVRRPAAPSSS